MAYVIEQKISMMDLFHLNISCGEDKYIVNHLEYLVTNGVILHNNRYGFMYILKSFSFTDTFTDNSRTYRFEIEIVNGDIEDAKQLEDFRVLEVI